MGSIKALKLSVFVPIYRAKQIREEKNMIKIMFVCHGNI